MNSIDFFKDSVGVFQGFSNSGLEFHAEIMLPYKTDFQVRPMHGSFLLVELENEEEAVLGRISSLQSMGRLSGAGGSEYAIRALQRNTPIPEDIREDHLRYKVDIRVLGVLRKVNGSVVFAPSHRRLPHVGSKVAFPGDNVLKEIACDKETSGQPLGHLALGEYIYALGDQARVKKEIWHQLVEPTVTPRFDISHMVSRKTFIFARAGYGKSNLNKLLFSELYKGEKPPTIRWSDGTEVPVGTLIFDPEGEYFWPDSNGRPGFADVPELKDRLMIFTDRNTSSAYYNAFKMGPAKIDITTRRPSEILNMGLSEERLTSAWASRLSSVNSYYWSQAITLIEEEGYSTDLDELASALNLSRIRGENWNWELSQQQLIAIRRELNNIVNQFHKSGTVTLEAIEEGLRQGMIIIFDLSQMHPYHAENITKFIMRHIFKINQNSFTDIEEKPIPTITVIEEAQTVLGGNNLDDTDPVVSWVKEGRKYNLGAVLVTQQPGAISDQILSQGDNWFVFHLISGVDLSKLKKANGHFSDDLLQSLLNEPIKGQGMFWSSESERPYPIPIRVFPFEQMYEVLDHNSNKKDNIPTIQNEIRERLILQKYNGDPSVNIVAKSIDDAMESLANDKKFMNDLRNKRVHTNYFAMAMQNKVNPHAFADKRESYRACKRNIKEFMQRYIGEEKTDWITKKGKHKGANTDFYVVKKRNQ